MKPNSRIPTDPIFNDYRLAKIYDDFDPDRSDLIPYVDMIKDLKATRVVDLGCGTGSLALLLQNEGIDVLAVDPAEASIDVAKSKSNANKIEWIVGGADILPTNSANIVVMAGNTVQAIVEPTLWSDTLNHIRSALKAGGHLIFETRNPGFQAWKEWNKEKSIKSIAIDGVGLVDGWVELLKIDLPLVSFRWTYFFHNDDIALTSDSTLRFRTVSELTHDLTSHGFNIEDIREAPDRPGKEHVVIAQVS